MTQLLDFIDYFQYRGKFNLSQHSNACLMSFGQTINPSGVTLRVLRRLSNVYDDVKGFRELNI